MKKVLSNIGFGLYHADGMLVFSVVYRERKFQHTSIIIYLGGLVMISDSFEANPVHCSKICRCCFPTI